MKRFSIIIPVYNNWVYTSACLKSIYELTGYPIEDFEVVVVDDDSEDGTSLNITEFINLNPNLRYLLNDRNLGFAATCNRGAADARGEYLIFLNNDTRVTLKWDKHLVETIEKDQDIWIVGAKCIYPDGTIQHAGVAFPEFYENYLDHLYRGVPAFFPLADHEKDYQSVTAACFIIRQKDFMTLNGFDERYHNGFEDVDLCLRVKAEGKRIVYQPRCEVIHYESKSEGRLDAMNDNKTILLDRWKDKILPDEVDHIRRDIEQATKSGCLHLISCFNGRRWKTGLKIFGEHEVLKTGELVLQPSKKPVRIIIPAMIKEIGVHILLTGEIQAESYGILQMNYQTKQENFYSDKRCFTKKIYSGHNVFCFTLYSRYLNGDLILTLSGFKKKIILKTLSIYSFSQDPSLNLPSLAIVCHISAHPTFINSLFDSLTKIKSDLIRMEVLITADDHVYPDLPVKESQPDIGITYRNCHYADLPDLYNEFIEKSDCKYVLSISDGVAMTSGRIERFLELMETNPEIGVIYGETNGLISIEGIFPFQKEIFQKATLHRMKDIPIAIRTSSWRDAGGYDARFGYYSNLDLCIRILSTGNWIGYQLEGIRATTFINTSDYPLELKARLEDYRELFFSRHSKYLLNQWKLMAAERSRLLKMYRKAQFKHSHHNPHATLIGSLKTHFSHFFKKIMNKRGA